ncbi:putative protein phosphatase 2C 24 [Cocos nucifera]|uniref:protein-serine/threonine phosphatase n=1 Tax=Cocos nucifera TaxID=13894 RepID=A0A8K0ISL0_COCNU|nr:putative protein phosphatase 2C 24 [Cocos nucifera]
MAVADAACEPRSRAARRRRMEIRRFKFIASSEEVAPADEELSRKRRRLHCSASPKVLRKGPDEGAVEERVDRCNGTENTLSSDADASSGPEAPQAKAVGSGPSDLGPRYVAVGSGPSDLCPRYGMTTVRGRRREMEDAVSMRPDFLRRCDLYDRHHFFGVYDGHGCSHVAVSCKDRMHEIVAEEAEKMQSGPPPAEEWREVMERSFARMDAEAVAWCGGCPREPPSCRCELQTPRCDHVGSTAVVAVVEPTRIVVANCGDSRAVLCRNGVPIPLSSDHKPDRPDELERIEAAGGRVIYWEGARVLGVLAMSRAIGDGYLKPYVISEPEVSVTVREEGDECLILASDGLWDVVTNETACDIARMCLRSGAPAAAAAAAAEEEGRCMEDKVCSDAAMLLTKLALARQSADNISVVVIDLKRNSD